MGANASCQSTPEAQGPICECHKVNWMSIIKLGEYKMVNDSPLQNGVSCDDKVEIDHMTEGEYDTICKYIPGREDSRFPQEVIQYLLDTNSQSNVLEDVVDNEKKSSVGTPDTIAWWQEPGDTPVGWEQQTLDPILLALNSKAICSRMNRRIR